MANKAGFDAVKQAIAQRSAQTVQGNPQEQGEETPGTPDKNSQQQAQQNKKIPVKTGA